MLKETLKRYRPCNTGETLNAQLLGMYAVNLPAYIYFDGKLHVLECILQDTDGVCLVAGKSLI